MRRFATFSLIVVYLPLTAAEFDRHHVALSQSIRFRMREAGIEMNLISKQSALMPIRRHW
jgi:hypothetical protein